MFLYSHKVYDFLGYRLAGHDLGGETHIWPASSNQFFQDMQDFRLRPRPLQDEKGQLSKCFLLPLAYLFTWEEFIG